MKNKTRIEYHTKSDEHGRCQFTLFWMADYHPGHPLGEYRRAERAQVFFTDPRAHGHPRPEDVHHPATDPANLLPAIAAALGGLGK